MASKKHGTRPAEWAKHLRPYGRKVFWKTHRQQGRREATGEDRCIEILVGMNIKEVKIERTGKLIVDTDK